MHIFDAIQKLSIAYVEDWAPYSRGIEKDVTSVSRYDLDKLDKHSVCSLVSVLSLISFIYPETLVRVPYHLSRYVKV